MEKLKNYFVWIAIFCSGALLMVSCNKEEVWDAGKTKVVADFEYSLDKTKAPATLTLTSKSTGGYTYYWTYTGGTDPSKRSVSVDETPKPVVYKMGGSYDVTLTVCNGTSCDEITKNFTLEDPDVTAGFSYAYVGGNDWAPASVNFTDESIGATGWTWTFEGGNPSTFSGQKPGAISYANYGKYAVKLLATGSKGSQELINTVKVYPTELICSSLTTEVWKTPLKYSGVEIGFVSIYLDKERINKTKAEDSKSRYRIYVTQQAAALLTKNPNAKAVDENLTISWDWDVVGGTQKLNMIAYKSGSQGSIAASLSSLSSTEMKFSNSDLDPIFSTFLGPLVPFLAAPLDFTKVKP